MNHNYSIDKIMHFAYSEEFVFFYQSIYIPSLLKEDNRFLLIL